MYKITKEQQYYFSSIILLENMANMGQVYSLRLENDDDLLQDLFIHMVSKDWVKPGELQYEITAKGIELLKNYLEKLEQFRSAYKVYSAVDLGEGEFAYQKYFEVDSDEQFDLVLDDEKYEDLRVAVCEFKKQDPIEMVFLEFVDAGRFDVEESGWQADLITGLIWDEILAIVNTNLKISDLKEEDLTGEEIITTIIEEGVNLMIELKKEEAKLAEEEAEEEESNDEDYDDDEDEFIEETIIVMVEEPVFELSYYDAYYDPFYVAPCFGVCYY